MLEVDAICAKQRHPEFGIFFFENLTLIQPGKGRFTLIYMSPDYLHGSQAGLPGWIRVKKT